MILHDYIHGHTYTHTHTHTHTHVYIHTIAKMLIWRHVSKYVHSHNSTQSSEFNVWPSSSSWGLEKWGSTLL